jgi:lipopolysaccharide/colanic/teichoic acid biosynthesis glycosyltransferase
VLKLNGYNSIGKPANDFRVTSWGKIIRKIWLDEIPQLLNVLKGDMNIVGVRPLSKVSFDLLPEDLKIKRIKYKPGCIPPNVSLCMKGLEGVINAERIYLDQMQHHQFLTPFKFFWMALFNIITHKVSSA